VAHVGCFGRWGGSGAVALLAVVLHVFVRSAVSIVSRSVLLPL
jgi:hypothetical protein